MTVAIWAVGIWGGEKGGGWRQVGGPTYGSQFLLSRD